MSDQGIKEHPKARLFAEKMIILTTIANSKNEIRSTQDIKKEIENIFKDEEGGVCFSTIHKSKGLEADNVHIIEPGLMPSKYAKKDWQKVQEENLRYVGKKYITRDGEYYAEITHNDGSGFMPFIGILSPIGDSMPFYNPKDCWREDGVVALAKSLFICSASISLPI